VAVTVIVDVLPMLASRDLGRGASPPTKKLYRLYVVLFPGDCVTSLAIFLVGCVDKDKERCRLRLSVADPGSAAFLTPWSGIRNRLFPDLRSRIPYPYF
jgi:hypothetical protein